ncbi:CAAX protease self-immunity [Paenimyroides aquimaris]|uniref:CAAX protease self-immunity n=1 Tax=Paenimyroides marinum TaxID=1159016 RepID=A0A1H6L6H8_9FLAO|nr:CPBP family intramembrane glutamic endopeptidase [Paenimyroides aquimaris]SEH84093.1 CAAX protease self-immunity [Paenimyroides aquimaris]
MKLKTNIYIKVLILFIITFATGVALRQCLSTFTEEALLEIFFKSFLATTFVFLIYLFSRGKWDLFTPVKWKNKYWILILILIILFSVNNYFQVLYSENQYYPEMIKSALGISIIGYIISSTTEEIIYRGFLQPFINANTISNFSVISRGNLFATALFFLTHLGFFTVMDPVFAVLSLVNVIIYSLIAGYLFDRTKNIFVLIVLHIFLVHDKNL